MNIDGHRVRPADISLGCLNCTVQLSALKGFACNPILNELARAIRSELRALGSDIGQLNMTLAPEVDVDGVASLSVIQNQTHPLIGAELDEPVERGRLDVNLRADVKPDHLHAAVTRAMTHTWSVFPNILARMGQMEHFLQPPIAQSAATG